MTIIAYQCPLDSRQLDWFVENEWRGSKWGILIPVKYLNTHYLYHFISSVMFWNNFLLWISYHMINLKLISVSDFCCYLGAPCLRITSLIIFIRFLLQRVLKMILLQFHDFSKGVKKQRIGEWTTCFIVNSEPILLCAKAVI